MSLATRHAPALLLSLLLLALPTLAQAQDDASGASPAQDKDTTREGGDTREKDAAKAQDPASTDETSDTSPTKTADPAKTDDPSKTSQAPKTLEGTQAEAPVHLKGADEFGLSIDDCVNVPRAVLARLIGIELGQRPLLPQETSEKAAQIQINCLPDEHLLVTVDNPQTERKVQRKLEMSNTSPPEQPRLIALAVSELVETSNIALPKPKPDPEPRPEPEPPPERSPREPTAPPASWELLVWGNSRGAFNAPRFTPGGGLGLLRLDPESALLHAGLDLQGGFQRSTIEGLGAIGALLVSGGFYWMPGLVGERLAAQALIGARLGVVQLRAEPSESASGEDALRPFGGPLLGAQLAFKPFGRFVTRLSVESGWALLGVRARANDEVVTAIEGAWLTASLGLGWSF